MCLYIELLLYMKPWLANKISVYWSHGITWKRQRERVGGRGKGVVMKGGRERE